MLCRHNYVRGGYNIYPTYRGGANADDVIAACKSMKLNFCLQHEGNKDTRLIRWACSQGYGCAVGRKGHVFVVTHYGSDGVKVIDNSGRHACKPHLWTVKRFHEIWNGKVYVILPAKGFKHPLPYKKVISPSLVAKGD
jgi:hypothetical protein